MAKSKNNAHTAQHAANRNGDNGASMPNETMPEYFSTHLVYPWLESTSRMTSAALDYCAEAIHFTGQRFERARDTVSSLPDCSNWNEVMKLQMDWASHLVRDYVEESRQFLEIARKVSGAAATRAANSRPQGE